MVNIHLSTNICIYYSPKSISQNKRKMILSNIFTIWFCHGSFFGPTNKRTTCIKLLFLHTVKPKSRGKENVLVAYPETCHIICATPSSQLAYYPVTIICSVLIHLDDSTKLDHRVCMVHSQGITLDIGSTVRKIIMGKCSRSVQPICTLSGIR